MKINILNTPHIPELPENQINIHMKNMDKEDANANLEKHEIVYNPNKGTLHKVIGNTHAKGGVNLNLDDGSFIFSNYKKLSFDKDDIELMEFKEGGKFSKKSNYTPSKVLEREIAGGLKHHNKMLAILNKSDKNDWISKQTAELMLQKNLEKVGQVAFLQEEKKKFKEGVPEISLGTAPVYDPNLNEEMKRAMQYNPNQKFQRGGTFNLPVFQSGTANFNPQEWYERNRAFLSGYDPNYFMGVDLKQPAPKGVSIREQVPGLFNRYITNTNSFFSTDLGTELNPANIEAYQNYTYQQAPEAIDYLYNSQKPAIRYNNKTPQISPNTYKDGLFNRDGVQFSYIKGRNLAEIDANAKKAGLIKVGNDYVFPNGEQSTIFRPFVENIPQLNAPNPEIITEMREKLKQNDPSPLAKSTPQNATTPQSSNNTPTQPYRYKIGLTPGQQLNLAMSAAQALGVKSYLPFRQHQESVLTQPQLFDAQPHINQANRAYFDTARLNRAQTNSQMALAANEYSRGQTLDQIDKVIGDVQNQNVQLTNASRERNANILNQDAAMNRQFDKRYGDEVVTALQNRDDARQYAWNEFMNEKNQYMSEAQQMENALNSQRQYRTAIKDKNGKIIGYRSGLPYEPVKGFWGYGLQYNPNIDSEAVLDSNIDFGQTQKDGYTQMLMDFVKQNMNSTDKATSDKVRDAMKSLGLLRYSQYRKS